MHGHERCLHFALVMLDERTTMVLNNREERRLIKVPRGDPIRELIMPDAIVSYIK
jgi:hypothetical protein